MELSGFRPGYVHLFPEQDRSASVIANWEEVQAVANVILVLTSAGAIGYASLQLRHEREYRSVTNLEKQLSFFVSDTFVAARRRLAETRLTEDGLVAWELEEPPIASFEVLDFYDHLGLLVRKGHLDVQDVWHTFYEWAQPVYVDLQKIIEDPGSEYADHYADLRQLMRAMDEIQIGRMHKKEANHWALWTPARIREYYGYEIEAGEARRQRRPRMKRTRPHAQQDDGPHVLDASGHAVQSEKSSDA